MSEVSVWFCRPGCDCQRCNALREVPRLAAENARLRGDNRKLDDALIAERQYNGEAVAENARLRGEMERRACPCLHTTPCHPDCTCANPLMSRGCERCCTYGSPEQQKAAAERLAALTADLARVTGERDDLKEWKVLHTELSGDLLARVTAERDAAASSLMAIAQLKQIEDEVKREKFWKTKKPRARCGTGGER